MTKKGAPEWPLFNHIDRDSELEQQFNSPTERDGNLAEFRNETPVHPADSPEGKGASHSKPLSAP